MKIAVFGGTFDPVHRGHLAVARAAAERFDLGKIYFVPADVPPHKQKEPLTSFYHRYAMLALATSGEKAFVPSLIEAGEGDSAQRSPSYSIETVRRIKRALGKSDRLFFLIGIDAFMDIATWYRAEALLRECDFIVASRPGYSLADVADALPQGIRLPAAVPAAFKKQPAKGTIALGGTTIHILDGLREAVSATQVRAAAARGRDLHRYVPQSVAEYIRKTGLYKK
jgi:nicotinate-nucleotide adenylyltransferase